MTKCAESQDLRLESLGVRKATLAKVLARAAPGLRLNEHMEEEDGPLVFHHACKLGPEGIVSKRKDSRNRPEGNHLMVLLSDDMLGTFPSWTKSQPR